MIKARLNVLKPSGFIYIASYDGYPNALKIGFTKGCPIGRVKQMNDCTYTMGTFTLITSYRTANVKEVESTVHEKLTKKHMRKEFFNVSVDEAKAVIESSILPDDMSHIKSLVKDCVYVSDFDRSKVNLLISGAVAVVDGSRVDFYALSERRMEESLYAEEQYENGYLNGVADSRMDQKRIRVDLDNIKAGETVRIKSLFHTKQTFGLGIDQPDVGYIGVVENIFGVAVIFRGHGGSYHIDDLELVK